MCHEAALIISKFVEKAAVLLGVFLWDFDCHLGGKKEKSQVVWFFFFLESFKGFSRRKGERQVKTQCIPVRNRFGEWESSRRGENSRFGSQFCFSSVSTLSPAHTSRHKDDLELHQRVGKAMHPGILTFFTST